MPQETIHELRTSKGVKGGSLVASITLTHQLRRVVRGILRLRKCQEPMQLVSISYIIGPTLLTSLGFGCIYG